MRLNGFTVIGLSALVLALGGAMYQYANHGWPFHKTDGSNSPIIVGDTSQRFENSSNKDAIHVKHKPKFGGHDEVNDTGYLAYSVQFGTGAVAAKPTQLPTRWKLVLDQGINLYSNDNQTIFVDSNGHSHGAANDSGWPALTFPFGLTTAVLWDMTNGPSQVAIIYPPPNLGHTPPHLDDAIQINYCSDPSCK